MKFNNPELLDDITLSFDDDNKIFSGVIPQNISVKNLVASFEFLGSEVEVADTVQVSGITENDFTQTLIYDVSNGSDIVSYSIDVTRFTGLPVISIETKNFLSIDSRDVYLDATLEIEGWRYFDSILETSLGIRGRGHSTWDWYPKKPYQIKFDVAKRLLGMPEARRWVLLAEYADKTMIRNTIAFEMGKLSDFAWVPKSQFMELFLNDEYQGTYNLVEKIELSPSRIDPNRAKYLLEIDQAERLNDDDPRFSSNFFLFHLKDPQVSQDSSELSEAKSVILELEDALLQQRFSDDPDGYRSLINLNSFVDWFLINEITKNLDAGTFYSSVYFTITVDEKIELGPIWDFDLSMVGDYEGWWMTRNPWFEILLLDPFL